jgi:CyaY protein
MTAADAAADAAAEAEAEAAYRRLAEATLATIEATADRLLQDDVIDIDASRTGGLLELRFPSGAAIIVNTQPPLRELWLAARQGGHHFKIEGDRWLDTRTGEDFFALLSRAATAAAGREIRFSA